MSYIKIFYFLFARPLWRESIRTGLMMATVVLGVAVVLPHISSNSILYPSASA